MRKAAFPTVVWGTLLFAFGASLAATPGTPKVKRYKVKSGIIEMVLTGTESGTEVIYFDDWGWKEAKYKTSVVEVMGFKQETKQLTLMDGEWTYNVDLKTNKGSKMKTPLLEELSESAHERGEDLTDTGMQMMEQMGGKKVGTGVVAGKNCEIWEIASMGTKTWVWNGVTLKVESALGGMKMGQEAKSLKFDVEIPPDKLKLPKGATITEGPDISDIMKGFKRN